MRCKVDPFAWVELLPGAWFAAFDGRALVRVSEPGALFVRASDDDGEVAECLVGRDTEFDVSVSYPFEFQVVAPEGARVFVLDEYSQGSASSGDILTNIERRVEQSGSLYEVKKALRLQQFQRRELMATMRENAVAMQRMRESLRAEFSPGEGIQKKPSPGDAPQAVEPAEKPGEGIQKKPSPGDAKVAE